MNNPGYRQPARQLALLVALGLVLALSAAPAHAYIGPGAGFAVLGSFLVVLVTLVLAAFTLATWPLRYIVRVIRGRRAYSRSKANRLVIVGLDGLDPRLVDRMMGDGKLPNFERLRQMGSYSRLETTTPPLSPVAWSSFQTGVNPGRHNIYDFLTRNPKSYLPDLSSTEITPPRRFLRLGEYRIPLSRPGIRLLRRSKSFWSVLSEHGIWSTILRVPITFPPERFNGLLLSAMCVPDLKGSQGTFCFFTTGDHDRQHTGGVRLPLKRNGKDLTASIPGPPDPLSPNGSELDVPFTLTPRDGGAVLSVCGQRVRLKLGEHSEWVRLTFKAGLGVKVSGVCRFMLRCVAPECELYATPINIDPERPAMPVSHPVTYSIYLSKLFGPYATLGLAEDTWALNERVIDEQAFLEQTYLIHDERERMFFDALGKTRRGVCACVFDATDRIQHMFYRYLDERHPALRLCHPEPFGCAQGKLREEPALSNAKGSRPGPLSFPASCVNAIENIYHRADDLVGRVMSRLGKNDVLLVISDHGFRSFRRGVNLNSWLHREGYLALKDGDSSSGEWFANVDWERTRAFAIGLAGIYLNRKGREERGVVTADEADALRREIAGKLSGLRDPDTGEVAINKAFEAAEVYSGPYIGEAPDLIIGYNDGYRTSWDGAVGKVNDVVFEDNTRSWSGDHCIDPALVPGVLFCSRAIAAAQPRMVDIAATALDLFGVERPGYMDGRSLFGEGESAPDR